MSNGKRYVRIRLTPSESELCERRRLAELEARCREMTDAERQSPWNPEPGKVPTNFSPTLPLAGPEGPVGGNVVGFPGSQIKGTDDPEIYRTCRYGMAGYRFKVPPGKYRVTLKFCEPAYDGVGKRIFDVSLQGKPVLKKFDIFARVGKFAALDFTFNDVEAADGGLALACASSVDLACIQGITVEGKGVTRKINCGGPQVGNYAGDLDWPRRTPRTMHAPRGLSTADFYADWARANFGGRAAGEIAAVFERIDGNLPRVLHGCPCGVNADNRPWSQVTAEYEFVDALEECRKKLRGAGNLARFDYWLNALRYLRAAGAMECALGRYHQAMGKVNAEKDPAKRKDVAKTSALPAYREVFRRYREALGLMLRITNTPGAFGTVANWQQRYYPAVVERPAAALAGALGERLPADLQPTKEYKGPPRLILPTVCGTAVEGESLPLRVIVLSEKPPREQKLHWRPMGTGKYAAMKLKHVARGVYSAVLPPLPAEGIEYYVEAKTADGQRLVFPATAPRLNQAVVALPQ